MGHTISAETIIRFKEFLHHEERESATINKYIHDISRFASWLETKPLNREIVLNWKEHLAAQGLKPSTVNSILSALNKFFAFIDRRDCRVKYLKIQRCLFRSATKDLSLNDYKRLLNTAQLRGKARLALLMETICATGIRVSETAYITVEAAKSGRTDIALKGKIRTILLPRKLCRKLLKYAHKQKIASGEIFLTRSGKGMSRRQIWAEMKAICKAAGVLPSKVFPHNLRHLFASRFYQVCRDIVKLADVLGHSSIETTRIYLISTDVQYARQLERLGLVL